MTDFAKEVPIVFDDDLATIEFSLENRSGNSHTTEVVLQGLPRGEFSVWADGRNLGTLQVDPETETVVRVPVAEGSQSVAVVMKYTTE